MTCKSKVQKINNTLTGNKQKLFLKPPRSLPASVMKRKQSQEFVLRMPLKMGCLKIAKVELWQKNKKFKANTKEALCKKWLRYRGTPECSIPKSLYTQKMYFTYCHFNQVFHLHCAEFNKRGCFSIRQLGGGGVVFQCSVQFWAWNRICVIFATLHSVWKSDEVMSTFWVKNIFMRKKS